MHYNLSATTSGKKPEVIRNQRLRRILTQLLLSQICFPEFQKVNFAARASASSVSSQGKSFTVTVFSFSSE